MSYTYLAYYFGVSKESSNTPLFIGTNEHGAVIENVNELLCDPAATIITYDFWKLSPFLRENKLVPKASIIDICSLARLMHGKSKKDLISLTTEQNPFSPWSSRNIFYEYFEDKEYFNKIQQSLFNNHKFEDQEAASILTSISKLLPKVFVDLNNSLSERGEKDRYYRIEKSAFDIFQKRELLGIKVDKTQLQHLVMEQENEISNLKRKLRQEYDLYGLDDLTGLEMQIQKLNLSLPASKFLGKVICDDLRILSRTNIFFSLLYQLKKTIQNKSILLDIFFSISDRVYPHFDSLGTVTARIQLFEPSLQNIKKEYRTIISADEGFQLVYCDYSQFEPGILASLSEDPNLIADYNEGDIYLALSRHLFGNENERGACKIIFIAYCYGISEERIVELLAPIDSDRDMMRNKIQTFFGRYKKLVEFRIKLQQELLRTGKIGTLLGNYRYRVFPQLKKLSGREQRWVISQRVQGTASLIFKKGLIDICQIDNYCEVLIPLHDGALFQVPIEKVEEAIGNLRDKFINAYIELCPQLKPRIEFPPF